MDNLRIKLDCVVQVPRTMLTVRPTSFRRCFYIRCEVAARLFTLTSPRQRTPATSRSCSRSSWIPSSRTISRQYNCYDDNSILMRVSHPANHCHWWKRDAEAEQMRVQSSRKVAVNVTVKSHWMWSTSYYDLGYMCIL